MKPERLLVINRLNFMAEGTQILKEISLEADKGEFIGLIGPNGAGKTTLLKCIDGLYRGTGQVIIDGTSLDGMIPKRIAAKVAMLHQDTTVAFPFTALDIVLTGRYHKLGRLKSEGPADYAAARRYMEYTGTLEFEGRNINTLSGGERQRVLFAKALAQETGLILLDEPSASMDIAHEEQIFQYSAELCRQGKTVIAAVHDLKTAVRFCTRLVLMKGGRILADGSPEAVVTQENLSGAYGVKALVYRNRITGHVDFHIPGVSEERHSGKIHVIGGGGSASGVIRQLYESGFQVTAGVFAHGDSDLVCTEVFGIPALVCQPFSEINDEAQEENIGMIRNADITILCDMPFGLQNLRNLEAASHANRLVIIENDSPESRDFTGGRALELYGDLKRNAIIIDTARLHEVLP